MQWVDYLEDLIYYLIENLENLKNILNNYYLRNLNKLRSKQLKNSFKKRVKNENKNNISELFSEEELLISLINDDEINN